MGIYEQIKLNGKTKGKTIVDDLLSDIVSTTGTILDKTNKKEKFEFYLGKFFF